MGSNGQRSYHIKNRLLLELIDYLPTAKNIPRELFLYIIFHLKGLTPTPRAYMGDEGSK